jgi:hypothetical protein
MTGISLATWASIAEIIGAGSIVTGLIVGWVQIRALRAQQRDAVALNLAQTFYDGDFSEALSLMQKVPDGVTRAQLREMGREYEEAAITVTTSFETMGLLAFKRIAPMELVMDLAGGIISVMCNKLRVWLQEVREEQDQPSFAEWFEWLGDQAVKRKKRTEPAHILYRDWEP